MDGLDPPLASSVGQPPVTIRTPVVTEDGTGRCAHFTTPTGRRVLPDYRVLMDHLRCAGAAAVVRSGHYSEVWSWLRGERQCPLRADAARPLPEAARSGAGLLHRVRRLRRSWWTRPTTGRRRLNSALDATERERLAALARWYYGAVGLLVCGLRKIRFTYARPHIGNVTEDRLGRRTCGGWPVLLRMTADHGAPPETPGFIATLPVRPCPLCSLRSTADRRRHPGESMDRQRRVDRQA